MKIKRTRDKLDAPSWQLSCGCCDGFDFREFLREQQILKETLEEIGVDDWQGVSTAWKVVGAERLSDRNRVTPPNLES